MVFICIMSDYMYFSALKLHLSVRCGEQCIVFAHADIVAGKEFRAALPDNDRAGAGRLAGIKLDASILCIAVSAVSRRALSLFMCHCKKP